jgi:hypothetical protein
VCFLPLLPGDLFAGTPKVECETPVVQIRHFGERDASDIMPMM